MSTTRLAPPGADPDASNERYLASAKLRGIAIGLNIVARVARIRPPQERDAMLWLCNYARLRDLTADALSGELDLDRTEIRRALTDPDADLTRFVRQVDLLRGRFERHLHEERAAQRRDWRLVGEFDKALGKIADTKVRRKIGNAFKMALAEPQIIEITGKTRMGKSICARHEYFKNLHRACWLTAPFGPTEKDWTEALGSALGVHIGTNGKNSEARPKIMACFGPNRINLLIVDEAHYLWPKDLRNSPSRIEFLRFLWELHGVSVIILATPQYSEALTGAMNDNPRWAPGQWVGRVQTFPLADTMSEPDLAAVARHHAPDASEPVIKQLVEQALSSEGYCGAMVKAIERARFKAEAGRPLTVELVKEAQRQLEREARVAALTPRFGRNGRAQ